LKAAISVKKLDNSIMEFQQLSLIADFIRKHRTYLYLSNKKDKVSEEVDSFAEMKASIEGKDAKLISLFKQ